MDDVSATVSEVLGADHLDELRHRFAQQVAFSAGARVDRGFGYLDSSGRVDPTRNRELYLNCRMTHLFSLAGSLDFPGAAGLADHGVTALRELFVDPAGSGWVGEVDADGAAVPGRKVAYDHAFVVLAASGATAAGRPGAAELLQSALDVVSSRFWEPDPGLSAESFDRDFGDPEPYRGGNSNMHMLEALIAAGDITGDRLWHDRALSIAENLANRFARSHGWRVVEHFDGDWNPVLDYNIDNPADPFRPYGTTVGHWLEWARLLVQLDATLPDSPRWLAEAAVAMFDKAVDVGWSVDGHEGFIYTLDWNDHVVVDIRLHWVICEAIGAAAALFAATGDDRYLTWYQRFWAHAGQHFIDPVSGTWIHELDRSLHEAATMWPGRPDPYHAATALLVPQLPLAPAAAVTLARGR